MELQAVYLRGTTYLRTPLFGMIPVVTLFVKGPGAVVVHPTHVFSPFGADTPRDPQNPKFWPSKKRISRKR